MGLLHVLAALLLVGASAEYAVDVSADTLPGAWSCLAEDGFTRAIIRAYRSDGSVDTAAPHTIYNAQDGGIAPEKIDIYVFPCPHCSDPGDQIQSTIDYLQGYSANFSMMWLDIEDTSNHDYWGTDVESNKNWMTQLYVAAVTALGRDRVGIYSSQDMWPLIFSDSSFDCCSSAALWYAHYDGGISFGDFQSFGGWQTPAGKQYEGSVNRCGAGVDLSYFE